MKKSDRISFFFGIVSICAPNLGFFSYLMVYCSFLFYYIGIANTICFFVLRRLTFFLIIFWGVLIAIWNEAILKNIIRQPRPEGACRSSYGMPSGHSVFAIFFLVWAILEIIFGTRKKWRPGTKVAVIFVFLINTVLIPYSRVYLGYHTVAQVIVGSICGAVYAILVYLVLTKYRVKIKKWIWKLKCVRRYGLVDDYLREGERPAHKQNIKRKTLDLEINKF
ncbi:dolichyldiphosphatase 1 [Anaeramoeba flamelloides]|uniref:Dolichyldiphosphatase 1 n=1 Tax=Anaeramoeba flamelloides TaxID=1746091 RepID=A0ABQ8YC65_9EUKA|nr:dolichyldiphosphatase 1 [Anaeramoeba flamelloides]